MNKYTAFYNFKNCAFKEDGFIDGIFLCVSKNLEKSIDMFMKNKFLDDALKQQIIDGRKLYLKSFLACKETAKLERDGNDLIFSFEFNKNNPGWCLISQMKKNVFISEFMREFVLNWKFGLNLYLFGTLISDEQRAQFNLINGELEVLLNNQYNQGTKLFVVKKN